MQDKDTNRIDMSRTQSTNRAITYINLPWKPAGAFFLLNACMRCKDQRTAANSLRRDMAHMPFLLCHSRIEGGCSAVPIYLLATLLPLPVSEPGQVFAYFHTRERKKEVHIPFRGRLVRMAMPLLYQSTKRTPDPGLCPETRLGCDQWRVGAATE